MVNRCIPFLCSVSEIVDEKVVSISLLMYLFVLTNLYPLLTKVCPQDLSSQHSHLVPFKMGFILLTFTGTSLTLIFHPLHMSILYRCNRKEKKNQNPILRSETLSHREQGSSQWQASAVQKKSSHRNSPVRIPGTVDTTTEQNGSCQLEPNL